MFDRLQFADLARHPLLAGGELVNIARHPLLAGRELVDAARYLLLSDGDPVDVFRIASRSSDIALSRCSSGEAAACAASPIVS